MSVAYPSVRRGHSDVGSRALSLLGVAGSALLTALLLSLLLYRSPPSALLVAGVGIGLVGTLALALARYRTAVAFGILLLGVVKIEPAPSDAVFMVVIALALMTGRFELRRVPPLFAALVGLYLALNVLSMIQAVDLHRAIRFSLTTFYLVIFSLWLVSWVRSYGQARLIVRAYVFAAVVSALLGTLALFLPLPGRSVLTYSNASRAVAFFKDPNVFGSFLVPAALIIVDESLSPVLLRSRRPAKALMFLALTLGVLFSFSRAAWLNLVLGLVVMLSVVALRRGGARKAVTLLGLTLGASVVVYTTLVFTGSVGFLQQRAHYQHYDNARFGAQQAGIRLVEHHPFGIGPGQFELAAHLSAHSTYIRALTELGVLGIVIVLALMLSTLVLAGRNVVVGRDTYGIGSATLLGAWCGLLVSGFVIDTLHWRHLWLVAALIWAGAAIVPQRTARPEQYVSTMVLVPSRAARARALGAQIAAARELVLPVAGGAGWRAWIVVGSTAVAAGFGWVYSALIPSGFRGESTLWNIAFAAALGLLVGMFGASQPGRRRRVRGRAARRAELGGAGSAGRGPDFSRREEALRAREEELARRLAALDAREHALLAATSALDARAVDLARRKEAVSAELAQREEALLTATAAVDARLQVLAHREQQLSAELETTLAQETQLAAVQEKLVDESVAELARARTALEERERRLVEEHESRLWALAAREGELDQRDRALATAQDELATAEADVSERERRLSAERDSLRVERERVSALEASVEEEHRLLSVAQEGLETGRSALAEHEATVMARARDLAGAERERAALAAGLERQAAALEAARLELDERERGLAAQLDSTRAELEERERRLVAELETVLDEQKTLAELQDQVRTQATTLAARAGVLAARELGLAARESAVAHADELREELELRAAALAAEERALTEARAELGERELRADAQLAERRRVEETDAREREEAERRREELDREAAALAARERELATAQATVEGHERLLATELEAARAERERLEENAAREEEEAGRRRAELEEGAAALAGRARELDGRQRELDERERELDAGRTDLEARDRELGAVRKSLDDREHELTSARAELEERERELVAARGRQAEQERELTALGTALAERERQLRPEAETAQAERKRLDELGSRLAKEREVLDEARTELERDREAIVAREQEVAQTAEALARSERAASERMSALDERERRLAAPEKSLVAREQALGEQARLLEETGRELGVRAERLEARATELDQLVEQIARREAELAERRDQLNALDEALAAQLQELRELPETLRELELEPEPEPATPPALAPAPVAPAPEPVYRPEPVPRPEPVFEPRPLAPGAAAAAVETLGRPELGEWNLNGLERLVAKRAAEFPDRVDEWRYYLVYLRDFARVDGTLPQSFDALVWETFGELVETR